MNNVKPYELSFISWKWLKSIGLPMDKTFVHNQIATHPDYPGLTSVTDFLDAGQLSYEAVMATKAHIAALRYPALVHIQLENKSGYLALVNSLSDWSKTNNNLQHWTGVAIYPNPNPSWKNKADIKSVFNNQYIDGIALFCLSIITFYACYLLGNIAYSLFSMLSLIGLVLSWLTFKTELGYQSQMVKQVCNSLGSAGSCSNVLKSTAANGLLGVSPAVAGLAWFITV